MEAVRERIWDWANETSLTAFPKLLVDPQRNRLRGKRRVLHKDLTLLELVCLGPAVTTIVSVGSSFLTAGRLSLCGRARAQQAFAHPSAAVSGTRLRGYQGAAMAVDWEELVCCPPVGRLASQETRGQTLPQSPFSWEICSHSRLASRPLSSQFHFPGKRLRVRTLKLC